MKIEITLNGFEAYLQEVHQQENPEILDDDLPEAFNDWLSKLEGYEFTECAESYFKDMAWAEKLAEAYFVQTFGKTPSQVDIDRSAELNLPPSAK